MSPDGGRALYARNGARDLWFVELAGGRTWEVLADLPKVTALAFLDSGDVMVKTDAWLAVYAVDRDRLVRLAAQETEVGPAVAWGGGRLLITSTVEAPELVVFGWYDGVLSRLADLSAPVNCYRVHVADGRAFAADRIPFEIVNLAPAWERFAAWVRERRCARQQADGLVVDEVASAPSHGIWAAPPAVREAADWYVTGPAGRTFALKRTGERYAALAGDVRGVRPFRPPLVARTFPYDWRPDGTAVLAYIGGRLVEADLAAGTARPLLDGAECFCYTAEGCAVVRQGSLVLYRWPHGTPTRPVRAGTVVLPYIGRVSYLGWADHGRVLHITIGGRTCFLAVHEGRLYPVGALRAREWFHVWARGEALYLQNTDEASGVPLRLYRVTGFDRAVAAALAGGPVERLVPDDLPPVFLSTSEYPGRTRWRLDGADVGFDDDVDEDDDY